MSFLTDTPQKRPPGLINRGDYFASFIFTPFAACTTCRPTAGLTPSHRFPHQPKQTINRPENPPGARQTHCRNRTTRSKPDIQSFPHEPSHTNCSRPAPANQSHVHLTQTTTAGTTNGHIQTRPSRKTRRQLASVTSAISRTPSPRPDTSTGLRV